MMAGQTSNLYEVDESFDSKDDERFVHYGATQDAPPMRGPKNREVIDSNEIDAEIPLQDFQQYGEQVDPLLSKKKKVRTLSPSYSPLHGAPSTHSIASSVSSDSATIVSTRSFSGQENWLRHPKVRENWRVLLGSFALTVIGCVLFLIGVGIVISPQRGLHCLVFFIIGLLCFIPGVYHLVYIYFAVKGRPGYDFYGLPAFK